MGEAYEEQISVAPVNQYGPRGPVPVTASYSEIEEAADPVAKYHDLPSGFGQVDSEEMGYCEMATENDSAAASHRSSMRERAAKLRIEPGYVEHADNYDGIDPAVAARLETPAAASGYLQVEGGMLYDESDGRSAC